MIFLSIWEETKKCQMVLYPCRLDPSIKIVPSKTGIL